MHDRIEAIPQDEIARALAEFEPARGYTKDAFVDADDRQGWKTAVVTSVEKDKVGIHYEAWGTRYDETLKTDSKYLAPFRKNSKGYTGQPRTPFRQFKYQREIKEEYEREMEKLMKDAFAIKDPQEYTQYFRGKIFFYVGSLLEILHFDRPDASILKEVFDFLKNYMQVLVTWMRGSFDLKEEFNALEKHQLLYLIHSRTAVCAAYNEVLEMISEFLGGCKRTSTNFQYFYETMENKGSAKKQDYPMQTSLKWCVTNFYRTFNKLGGLSEIARMVKTKYSSL